MLLTLKQDEYPRVAPEKRFGWTEMCSLGTVAGPALKDRECLASHAI